MLIMQHVALSKISTEALVPFKLHAVQTVGRLEKESIANTLSFKLNPHLNLTVTALKWIDHINSWTMISR